MTKRRIGTCEVCGKAIMGELGTVHKYCSKRCRKRRHRVAEARLKATIGYGK